MGKKESKFKINGKFMENKQLGNKQRIDRQGINRE